MQKLNPKEMKSRNEFGSRNPLNWPQNQTVSQNEPWDSDRIRPTHTRSVSSRLIIAAGSKDKSSCYNGSFVCGDTSIIGSNFWGLFHPLNTFPSSLQITTSLRATLCWTRPWSTKGSNWLTSELFRWSILVRIKRICLFTVTVDLRWIAPTTYFTSSIQQIYLWRSPTHQTSLTPVTMDSCWWCAYHPTEYFQNAQCTMNSNCFVLTLYFTQNRIKKKNPVVDAFMWAAVQSRRRLHI